MKKVQLQENAFAKTKGTTPRLLVPKATTARGTQLLSNTKRTYYTKTFKQEHYYGLRY